MRAVLIGNPNAGQKAGLATNSATVDDALAALKAAGLEPTVWHTERPGHAGELARQAVADGYELIVAAGGDGTLHEVAQPLIGTEATLGVMPLGSVMNLARTLNIDREDLAQAAHVICHGRTLRMDVGQAHDEYFLEFAGVGIDAALGPLTQQIDSGQWSSLGTLLRTVIRYRPMRLRVSVDGSPARVVRALMIVVANTPYYGPAVELTPEARVDDRQFDVKIFHRFSRLELLLYAAQILTGRRPYHPKVQRLRAGSIAIASSRPLPAHADFEPIGTTPVTFRLLPGALRVRANPVAAHDPTPASASAAASI